ncbi:MFS transporter [Tsuneonella mangrovi]|uniref:MFS transporter n=1 Tax=Tsuneonella mangrovi TaxID=1982042 RepID=UPI001237167E|nr:MFS transporter [Tsuneonella mangrovi]
MAAIPPSSPDETAVASTQPDPAARKREMIFAFLVVFMGITAVTLSQLQAIGLIPLKNLLKNELHESKEATAAFFFWIGLAWYFKPFFGIFTDAFPLYGTRRRSYILLGAVLAVLGFVALIFTPHHYGALLTVCILINVAMVITSTATGGYMTQKAQELKASGKFASVFQIAYQMAGVVGGPVGGLLAAMAFGYTGAAGAVIMLLPIPAAIFFLKEKRIEVDSARLLSDAGAQLKKIAAAKTMWAAAGFSFLFYFAPGIQTALFYRQQNVIHMTTEQQGLMLLLNGAFAMLTATFYGTYAAKRWNLRKLLFWFILAGGLAQMSYAFYNSMHQAIVIESLWGLGWAAADMALSDLYMRSAPAGSEALGFALMVSVRNLSLFGADWLGSAAMDKFHLQFSTMAITNGLISMVALPFVFLLSGKIVDRTDSAAEAEAIPPVPSGKAVIDEG